MPAILALVVTLLVGFVLACRAFTWQKAWLLASLVMPLYVLSAEFIFPYVGGGASMWPIALVFGTLLGIVSGGLGVATGGLWLSHRGDRST
jgi:hypothetical protein